MTIKKHPFLLKRSFWFAFWELFAVRMPRTMFLKASSCFLARDKEARMDRNDDVDINRDA